MNVDAVMTRGVATCRTADNLNRAAQLMWEQRCGCVPVGVLTDRDLSMAAYTQGRRLDDMPATTAMSRSMVSCLPSTSIEEAEDLMMAHAVHRLVVIDSEGRLSGIVSLDDIARSSAAWDGKSEIDLERVTLTLGEIARRNGSTDDDADAETPETDLFQLAQNSRAALETLRDEIRVDLNLAGKELRDRWRWLETRLHAAETRVRKARRGGARSFARLVDSARQLRADIHEKSTSAARSG